MPKNMREIARVIPPLNTSEVTFNCISGMKQATICVIAIGTDIITKRAKPKARHRFLWDLRKIPYIIQIAAITTSEMQASIVKTSALFRSSARIANKGIGTILTANKVFKMIFVFAVKKGSITIHAAMIAAVEIIDHESFFAVK